MLITNFPVVKCLINNVTKLVSWLRLENKRKYLFVDSKSLESNSFSKVLSSNYPTKVLLIFALKVLFVLAFVYATPAFSTNRNLTYTHTHTHIYIYIYIYIQSQYLLKTSELLALRLFRGCPRGVMVKAMDCGIVVSEFVLQSRYYVYFRANTLGKGMNPLILPTMGQIVQRLFYLENGFGIKYPTKVDMPLKQRNQTYVSLT